MRKRVTRSKRDFLGGLRCGERLLCALLPLKIGGNWVKTPAAHHGKAQLLLFHLSDRTSRVFSTPRCNYLLQLAIRMDFAWMVWRTLAFPGEKREEELQKLDSCSLAFLLVRIDTL